MEAQSIGDRLLIADSLAWLGNWYTNFERVDEARAALTEAPSTFREQGDKGNQAHVLDLLGIAETFSGDVVRGGAYLEEAATLFEESVGHLERAYRSAHDIGSCWFVSLSAGFLAQAYVASG